MLYLVTEQASCSSLAPRLQLSNKVKLCVKLKVRMAGEAGCLLVSPQQIDLLFKFLFLIDFFFLSGQTVPIKGIFCVCVTGDLEVICLLPLACPGLPFISLQAFGGRGEHRLIQPYLIICCRTASLLHHLVWKCKKMVFLSGHRCCHKCRGNEQPLWWIWTKLQGSSPALPCPCTGELMI